MQWIHRLAPRTRKSSEIALIRSIAHQSVDSVWEQVHSRLPELTSSEVRGYVRVKAGITVRSQLNQLAAEKPELSQASHGRVLDLARESVVEAILRRHAEMRQTRVRQAA